MTQLKTLALAAFALVSFGANAANLLVNGDFETTGVAGLATFSSDYAKAGSAYDPDTVNIGGDANALHSSWASFSAFSGGSMLIVNGGSDLAHNTVWSQAINVTAGTTYDFSGAAASVYGGNPSALRAVVSIAGHDFVIGNTQLSSTVGQWQSFTGQLTSSFTGAVQIKLLDMSTAYSGNDFAIDHLSVTAAVPEPETYALMLAGLGAIGFVAFRRGRRS